MTRQLSRGDPAAYGDQHAPVYDRIYGARLAIPLAARGASGPLRPDSTDPVSVYRRTG